MLNDVNAVYRYSIRNTLLSKKQERVFLEKELREAIGFFGLIEKAPTSLYSQRIKLNALTTAQALVRIVTPTFVFKKED